MHKIFDTPGTAKPLKEPTKKNMNGVFVYTLLSLRNNICSCQIFKVNLALVSLSSKYENCTYESRKHMHYVCTHFINISWVVPFSFIKLSGQIFMQADIPFPKS
jgi:hypothetical protein